MWFVYRIVTRTKRFVCVCVRLCLLIVDLGPNYLFSDENERKSFIFIFIQNKIVSRLNLGITRYEWELNHICPILWKCNSLFWHLNSLIFNWLLVVGVFLLFTFQFNSAYGIYINLLYEIRQKWRPTRMHLQMDTTISLCCLLCAVVWVSFHPVSSFHFFSSHSNWKRIPNHLKWCDDRRTILVVRH